MKLLHPLQNQDGVSLMLVLDMVVVEIVRRHVPDLAEGAVYSRESAHGNYVSVTVVVNATSRAQLDAIYQDLVECETVIMAL